MILASKRSLTLNTVWGVRFISGINSITYSDKTVNQFIGCTGVASTISSASNIRSDEIYFGYENGDSDKRVEIRLTGVLSNFIQVSEDLDISEGDIISVNNIGDLIANPSIGNGTYKEIFATKNLTENISKLNGVFKENPLVKNVIEFITKDKKRSICTPFS